MVIKQPLIMTAMNTFIEDYLRDPSSAISAACERAHSRNWYDEIGDDHIYKELASPEFHLYETVVTSNLKEDTPHISGYAVA